MLGVRVIPCLLMHKGGLVKTVKFKDPRYIGDPIVAVKIFNDREVDELCILDITTTNESREPFYERIAEIASEAFMPVSYGGGIHSFQTAERLFKMGIEKIVLNSALAVNPGLVSEIAKVFGNQAVVASIDVKTSFWGRSEVFTHSGTRNQKVDPITHAKKMEDLGAGEILLTSIDREGTMTGYDLNLIRSVSEAVSIPVVACGGAGSIDDLSKAVKEGKASAVAAGSFFVYHGKHRAVLINYPKRKDLEKAFSFESQ